jgi:hypothetical protein
MTKVVLGYSARFPTSLAPTPTAISADDGLGVVTIAAVVGDGAIRAVEI